MGEIAKCSQSLAKRQSSVVYPIHLVRQEISDGSAVQGQRKDQTSFSAPYWQTTVNWQTTVISPAFQRPRLASLLFDRSQRHAYRVVNEKMMTIGRFSRTVFRMASQE